MQRRKKSFGLEAVVSSLLVGCGVFAASNALACNNSVREKSFDTNQVAGSVGPFNVYCAKSMDANDILLATEAVDAHWQMYTTVYGYPTVNSSRNMFLYDVPLLNSTPYGVNKMGWTDVTSRDVHVAAGAGLTFPDAMHQIDHSINDPYDIYDQRPNPQFWVQLNFYGDLVVQALKQKRGLPP